jgi:eukaryotic-like serine/threonine-protein kinase
MTSNRADRLTSLYHAALERPAAERASFLVQACGGDNALRAEVESLLAYDAGSFLEAPAAPVAGVGPGTQMVNRQLGPYTIVAPPGPDAHRELPLTFDALSLLLPRRPRES